MPASKPTTAPLAILSPPDAVPSVAPVTTRKQLLPFEELSWENFERLCQRLTALDGNVDYCARYGRQGDSQEGIDIFARQADGRYHCLQAKRHRSFGSAKLRDAVDLFLKGAWAVRAARFTIAVQSALRSPDVQEEIERQVKLLSAHDIHFEPLDGEGLTDRLREHPKLVDDFFGRPWVAALLGQNIADSLGARLDGADFANIRAQLAKVYTAHFQFVDAGTFGSISGEVRSELTLLERFLKPDIQVNETVRPAERAVSGGTAGDRGGGGTVAPPIVAHGNARLSDLSASIRMRRMPLFEWLADSDRLIVLGEAGCGKSTLLRVVALDLLHDQEQFPEIAVRWGGHIPIYVPFARWSSQVAREGVQIGIKEIVRRTLDHLLTGSLVDLLDRAIDDRRVLLLIDGLDEWSSEQAARATLAVLVPIVEAHGIPVIVSGRPRGLNQIGALPSSWKRGTVAPLSSAQQAFMAGRWFERYGAVGSESGVLSVGSMRTTRFMAELARDANLKALATVPLLLIGLVSLALRGQILPRTKADVYDQLVKILLEEHPSRRATAAGDTEPRFRHVPESIQRRAAIAELAFAVRRQSGGAGMPLAAALRILHAFLASPQGLDLSDAAAAAAAREILSVNAETQGLIVEQAPGEIGFVHASFEEFLSAEHVSSWPFGKIEAFVRVHAGEARWRNVLNHLFGRLQRRDEFERLVAIIETPDGDELARFHRLALLGDIAFGAAMRAPASARRLALATMQRVEQEDWLPARREALASVLRGFSDPALETDIGLRLSRWLPARSSYSRASLVATLGRWQPTAELQDVLFQAMHDEDRAVQRAGAAAYAEAFAPSPEAYQRLLDGLARTRNLTAAAAMLEGVALGWSSSPDARSLFEEAWHSHSSDLCLVGILGLLMTGTVTDDARDVVLRGQSFWSEISAPYRELAVATLTKYWPGDEKLVEGALRCVSRVFDSPWELDVAIDYLLESSVDRADVRAWILAEFGAQHPFLTLTGDERRSWSQVGRFAKSDPEIRAAANAYWCEPKNQLFNLYKVEGYVAQVADPSIATVLIEVLCDEKSRFNRHWALSALLTGWGRDHAEVRSAINELIKAGDGALSDLAALLPSIMTDKAEARKRLIRMGSSPHVRRDLLAIGLQNCGCDGTDKEAVAAILAFPEKLQGGPFEPSETLFRVFGKHVDVRSLALERICVEDGPLGAIAAGYADDPEFAGALFGVAVPLPVELRAQVVEVAATGATGTMLEVVLGQAMRETDPDLRVRMVIAYHRTLSLEARDAARHSLLADAAAIGFRHESVRAAALAGLVTIEALDTLVTLEDLGKPIKLYTGAFTETRASAERLVCEQFAEFERVFGDSLHTRFETMADKSRLAEILSAAPSASPAARASFLGYAERNEIPLTPHSLRALAVERPHSELLLARCLDALGRDNDRNDCAMVNAEIGLILREHFPGNVEARKRLIEQFEKLPSVYNALPLAIFAPDFSALPFDLELNKFGHEFADWALAVYVAANRVDSTAFCRLLHAMVTRKGLSQFDAQPIINLAVEERLQRDANLEGLLSANIAKGVHPSISGSFARYLAAAGKLNPDARQRVIDLLQFLGSNQRLPVAGYDAVADQWRTTRLTLLDALSAGLEFG